MEINKILTGLNSCVSKIEGKTKAVATSAVDSVINTVTYRGRQIKDVTAEVASNIAKGVKDAVKKPTFWRDLGILVCCAMLITGMALVMLGLLTINPIMCFAGCGLIGIGALGSIACVELERKINHS